MARLITLAPALVTLTLAGCGGSTTKTVTQVQSGPGPAATTQTTATIPPVTIPSTTPSAPSGSGGTLPGAEAKVNALGFNADDPTDYDSSHTLHALIGTRKGSPDGYAKQASC